MSWWYHGWFGFELVLVGSVLPARRPVIAGWETAVPGRPEPPLVVIIIIIIIIIISPLTGGDILSEAYDQEVKKRGNYNRSRIKSWSRRQRRSKTRIEVVVEVTLRAELTRDWP